MLIKISFYVINQWKKINIQQVLFFYFLKKPGLKKDHSKSTVFEEGRGGGHWKPNKNEQGEGGVLACVHVHFF